MEKKNVDFEDVNRDQKKFHELMASWWMASAISGHALRRNRCDGSGKELSFEEKLDDAMATAKRHIELATEGRNN